MTENVRRILRSRGTVRLVAAVLAIGYAAVIGVDVAHSDPGARTLYLVRHGFYDYNDGDDPFTRKPLLPLGVAQARLLASRLRSMPVTFTALYSSTMTRARQTAEVVYDEFPQLEWTKLPEISECTPPTWRKDVEAESEPTELEECRKQLDGAFARLFVPSPEGERHDIVVCHANVIRYMVTRVLGVDTKSWLVMSLGNCSLTVVRVNPDGTMKLLMVGDVGHIPPNLQTGLDRAERVLAIPEG